jgi:hypothetical protein
VRVVLIPTVDEYKLAGLDNLMWWTSKDYKIFKASALFELKCVKKKNPNLDSKAILEILYQPITEQQRVENFEEKEETIELLDTPFPMNTLDGNNDLNNEISRTFIALLCTSNLKSADLYQKKDLIMSACAVNFQCAASTSRMVENSVISFVESGKTFDNQMQPLTLLCRQ